MKWPFPPIATILVAILLGFILTLSITPNGRSASHSNVNNEAAAKFSNNNVVDFDVIGEASTANGDKTPVPTRLSQRSMSGQKAFTGISTSLKRKKDFPEHWGSPPLKQTKDMFVFSVQYVMSCIFERVNSLFNVYFILFAIISYAQFIIALTKDSYLCVY